MTLTSTKVDKAVVEVIKKILHEKMDPFGLRDVHVRGDEDHDGDPVIYINAEYDLSERPIDFLLTSGLVGKLRDALEELDEERFPHVRHHFHEDQKVLGE